MQNEDLRQFCKIVLRCAKMFVKLLEDFLKEK